MYYKVLIWSLIIFWLLGCNDRNAVNDKQTKNESIKNSDQPVVHFNVEAGDYIGELRLDMQNIPQQDVPLREREIISLLLKVKPSQNIFFWITSNRDRFCDKSTITGQTHALMPFVIELPPLKMQESCDQSAGKQIELRVVNDAAFDRDEKGGDIVIANATKQILGKWFLKRITSDIHPINPVHDNVDPVDHEEVNINAELMSYSETGFCRWDDDKLDSLKYALVKQRATLAERLRYGIKDHPVGRLVWINRLLLSKEGEKLNNAFKTPH
jgi:hypothetical protein